MTGVADGLYAPTVLPPSAHRPCNVGHRDSWISRVSTDTLAVVAQHPGAQKFGMRMLNCALLPFILAGGMASVASLGIAQDASQARADLDAAAGRIVFQNVLLADPHAFSPPKPIPPQFEVEPLAPTGEASADRYQLDRAAGRPAFQSDLPSAPEAKREQGAGPRQRSVRVVLPLPYGKDDGAGCPEFAQKTVRRRRRLDRAARHHMPLSALPSQ